MTMAERVESRVVTVLKQLYAEFGLPRLIIAGFLVSLFILAFILKMNIGMLVSDSLVRVGMNGILVLSMLYTLACGVGLNFGLAVGVIAGLVGAVTSMNFDLPGFTGFFAAIAIAVPIAVALGWLYAELLERVKGQEMMVGTYVGYSIVAGMCIFWVAAPYTNPAMIFPLGGAGLHHPDADRTWAKVLNDFLAFRIGGLSIPTGLLLFFALFCVASWLFFRSKAGHAMRMVGANGAQSSGINVRGIRRLGVILSTVLGAIGIIVRPELRVRAALHGAFERSVPGGGVDPDRRRVAAEGNGGARGAGSHPVPHSAHHRAACDPDSPQRNRHQ